MITKDEILARSLEFGIHEANVQRDYVFGWLLVGVAAESPPSLEESFPRARSGHRRLHARCLRFAGGTV